jgi:hypothetical protein
LSLEKRRKEAERSSSLRKGNKWAKGWTERESSRLSREIMPELKKEDDLKFFDDISRTLKSPAWQSGSQLAAKTSSRR